MIDPAAPLESSPRPRNRVAFEAGRRNRETIRGIMLERARRYPLLWPLTAEQMRIELRRHGVYLSTSTVTWHMEQTRAEAYRLAALEAEKIPEKNDVSCLPHVL